MPAQTWPCRAAYSNASGLSGSVTGATVVEMCSGKASIGSMMNEKCSKHLSLLYVSDRMRVKNGTHGNPTMIAKGTYGCKSHLKGLNVFKCVRHTNSTNIEVD
ncbi:hypothetical protein TNCV_4793221 [Trichonephila clavipes]|nr:hypothetical protein TNCV_4793221 [Trichonephila clavipes]